MNAAVCVCVYVSVRNRHGLLDLSYIICTIIIFIDSSSSTGVALPVTVWREIWPPCVSDVSQVTDALRDKVPKCIVQ